MKFQILSANRRAKSNRAFTLVEIIVSLGIFSVVAVVALGALIRIITANRKAQTLQSAMTNVTFALESMSREMRVGSHYNCGAGQGFVGGSNLQTYQCEGQVDNTSGGSYIAFVTSKIDTSCATLPNKLISAYRLRYNDDNTWTLQKADQADCIDTINSDSDYSDILDPDIIITGYFIRVVDTPYPLATIRLSGYTGVKEKEKTYFDVQTAISSRSK